MDRLINGSLKGLASRDRIMAMAMFTKQAADFLSQDIEANGVILSDIKYQVMNDKTGKLEWVDLQPKDYGLIAAGDVDMMSTELRTALRSRGFDLADLRANVDSGRATRRAAMKLFTTKGDVIEQRQWLDAGYAANITDPFERRATADAFSEGVLGKVLGRTYFQANLMRGLITGPESTEIRIAERVNGNWSASSGEISDEKLVADTIAAMNTMKARGEEAKETAEAALAQIHKIAQEVMDSNSLPDLPKVVTNVLYRGGIPVTKNGVVLRPMIIFDDKKGNRVEPTPSIEMDPKALRNGRIGKPPMFESNRVVRLPNGEYTYTVGATALKLLT
jgi:hypothetical protein